MERTQHTVKNNESELLELVEGRIRFWLNLRQEYTECPPALSEMAFRCQDLFKGNIEECFEFLRDSIENGRLPFVAVKRVEVRPQPIGKAGYLG